MVVYVMLIARVIALSAVRPTVREGVRHHVIVAVRHHVLVLVLTHAPVAVLVDNHLSILIWIIIFNLVVSFLNKRLRVHFLFLEL